MKDDLIYIKHQMKYWGDETNYNKRSFLRTRVTLERLLTKTKPGSENYKDLKRLLVDIKEHYSDIMRVRKDLLELTELHEKAKAALDSYEPKFPEANLENLVIE